MRISVDKKDPGYSDLAWQYLPYLNGKKADNVITADEEEGAILRYKTDDAGNARVIGKGKNARPETETVYGEVKVVQCIEEQP